MIKFQSFKHELENLLEKIISVQRAFIRTGSNFQTYRRSKYVKFWNYTKLIVFQTFIYLVHDIIYKNLNTLVKLD